MDEKHNLFNSIIKELFNRNIMLAYNSYNFQLTWNIATIDCLEIKNGVEASEVNVFKHVFY